MGYQIATCCVSHLPINTGDKVVTFIVKPYDAGRALMPSDHGTPIVFPLVGVYNEEGYPEKTMDTPFNKCIIDLLKAPELTIDRILEDIANEDLKDYALYMVHHDLFMKLTDEPEEFDMKFERLKEELKSLDSDVIIDGMKMDHELFDIKIQTLLQLSFCHYTFGGLHADTYMTEFMKKNLLTLSDDNIEMLKRAMRFSVKLHQLRKSWACTTFCGSQTSFIEAPRIVAEYTLKGLIKIEMENEQDNE